MSIITNQDYWAEVSSIATNLVKEAMTEAENDKDRAQELIDDRFLHEVIDGHQWVIYYAYNLSVLEYSDNDQYMIDNIGLDSVGKTLKNGGLSSLHSVLAFWALYADAYNALDNAFDEYENSLESEE